jgi:hypothetical protein
VIEQATVFFQACAIPPLIGKIDRTDRGRSGRSIKPAAPAMLRPC